MLLSLWIMVCFLSITSVIVCHKNRNNNALVIFHSSSTVLLLGWWIGPHSWNLINFLLKHIILHWIFWIVLQILNCISTKLINSSKKLHLWIIVKKIYHHFYRSWSKILSFNVFKYTYLTLLIMWSFVNNYGLIWQK